MYQTFCQTSCQMVSQGFYLTDLNMQPNPTIEDNSLCIPCLSERTLYFSEWNEPTWSGTWSNYNKYLEIYNPTDAPIDLENEYGYGLAQARNVSQRFVSHARYPPARPIEMSHLLTQKPDNNSDFHHSESCLRLAVFWTFDLEFIHHLVELLGGYLFWLILTILGGVE